MVHLFHIQIILFSNPTNFTITINKKCQGCPQTHNKSNTWHITYNQGDRVIVSSFTIIILTQSNCILHNFIASFYL